jgi:aryl-alcohol dehydrogenase-like predicted oxidoreductase
MNTSTITRRDFIRTTAGGVLAAGVLAHARLYGDEESLPRRALGSTGLHPTILGLGCATIGFGGHSLQEGAAIVEACLNAGVTYVDCASSYGDAELKVGTVMRTRRKEAILATKTLERDRTAAWAEIGRSLERLQTDHVDLLQIHAVNSMGDLERVFAPGGSLAAATRARDEGLCKHIGITGHTRPEVIVEACRRFPFAAALVPLSSTDARVNDFGPHIFPLARERSIGVIAMKVLAAGKVTGHVGDSIRYSLSLPVSLAIVGMGTKEEVEANARIARTFHPMAPEELAALEEKTRSFASTETMWWKRT